MMMALVVPLVVAGLVLRTCVWEVCTGLEVIQHGHNGVLEVAEMVLEEKA